VTGRAVREEVAPEWLALLENRFAVQLRLGKHASAVGPLPALVAEHLLDESFVTLLMQALCGCGRQADALDVYAGLRNRLVDAIGDEPSERLRSLHASSFGPYHR
jgi:DNA-binding SARP family transcriptional activator